MQSTTLGFNAFSRMSKKFCRLEFLCGSSLEWRSIPVFKISWLLNTLTGTFKWGIRYEERISFFFFFFVSVAFLVIFELSSLAAVLDISLMWLTLAFSLERASAT